MRRLRVGVEGGAGYVGGELLRLLLGHPKVEIVGATSATYPGQPVFLAHPNLRGRTGLSFSRQLDPGALDLLFLVGGHGDSMANIPALAAAAPKGLRLIDFSGDFRLEDPSLYPEWYGREHKAPGYLKRFVYGIPELDRARVARARWVANPGCFATAAALALGPLARAGLRGQAFVTAVTGSSGSGASPSLVAHHPLRHSSMRAYKPLRHQHSPEIEQALARAAGGRGGRLRVSFVPVSGPFSRGIYAVAQAALPRGWDEAKVRGIFEAAYRGCAFVRVLPEPPALNAVVGSNHCDLHACARDGRVVVVSALDNLLKGAAGQAVQNMNVMLGWDEAEGLAFAGPYP